jgi:hypothetical protein
MVLVPIGFSAVFHTGYDIQIPCADKYLHYDYTCWRFENSLECFTKMKGRDREPDALGWGRCSTRVLKGPNTGLVRSIKDPVYTGYKTRPFTYDGYTRGQLAKSGGFLLGDLDHPVWSLVCHPVSGIPVWWEAIWKTDSVWGASGVDRWGKDQVILADNGFGLFSGECAYWDRLGVPVCLDIDQRNQRFILARGRQHWEDNVQRHYVAWKQFCLRIKCCELLRCLLNATVPPREKLEYISDFPSHILMAAAYGSTYGYWGY